MSIWRTLCAVAVFVLSFPALAQDTSLSVATVDRYPFATETNGVASGFSLRLMEEIALQLEQEVAFTFFDSFPEMLAVVESGEFDAAIANISITAAREQVLDFTQPIFESGIGVLLAEESKGNSVLSAVLTSDIVLAVLISLAVLFASGMLMWVFERKRQPYFDRKIGDALFPSFWWALNLVVNGGFEERMAASRMGRLFSVLLVISSLFVVSIFVATVTSALTVSALTESVDKISDLEGRRVATIQASTSADFLDVRELAYNGFVTPTEMFAALEAGEIDAIVFDAPILQYYARNEAVVETRMLPRIYRRENYGIALPQDSDLGERIDRTLLRLREEGVYDELVLEWFGASDS